MRDYRKYKVWKMGHDITLDVYRLIKDFPKHEVYGITSQMRRASSSIPSNVVEGRGRESDAEFKRFLIIAQSSANELEYFTLLARDLGYIKESIFLQTNDKADKVRRSLNSLLNKL